MRSSSPLVDLMTTPTPTRGRASRVLGWLLAIVAIVIVVMILIGFGVQQQAQHHIVTPTGHTGQQG